MIRKKDLQERIERLKENEGRIFKYLNELEKKLDLIYKHLNLEEKKIPEEPAKTVLVEKKDLTYLGKPTPNDRMDLIDMNESFTKKPKRKLMTEAAKKRTKKIYNKKYQAEHKEEAKEYHKKSKAKKARRKYYLEHRKQEQEKGRKYYWDKKKR